jgi:hypothetical protein
METRLPDVIFDGKPRTSPNIGAVPMSSLGSINGLQSSTYTSLLEMVSSKTQSASSALSLQSDSDVSETSSNENGVDKLKEKIDSAISAALAKLDKSSSADEIMQAIKSAVDTTMSENGVDKSRMQGQAPPPPPGGGQGPGGPGGPGGSGKKDEFMSKIESLLAANGFDVEKFESELEASRQKQQSQDSSLTLLSSLTATNGVDTQA